MTNGVNVTGLTEAPRMKKRNKATEKHRNKTPRETHALISGTQELSPDHNEYIIKTKLQKQTKKDKNQLKRYLDCTRK